VSVSCGNVVPTSYLYHVSDLIYGNYSKLIMSKWTVRVPKFKGKEGEIFNPMFFPLKNDLNHNFLQIFVNTIGFVFLTRGYFAFLV
jgi:hypothetical protein